MKVDGKPAPADFKTRFKAASVHFVLSLILFSVIVYLLAVHWYPSFHFFCSGGTRGLGIMAFCDLVLGPLLTLIIFNPAKGLNRLKFDLAVIGTVQVSALIYGGLVVYGERPAALVLYQNYFVTFPVRNLEPQNISVDRLRERDPGNHPPMLVSFLPENPEEKKRYTDLLIQGIPGFGQAEFLTNFKLFEAQVLDAHVPMDRFPEIDDAFTHFKQQNPDDWDNHLYLYYVGPYRGAVLVFTKEGRYVTWFGSLELRKIRNMAIKQLKQSYLGGAASQTPPSR